MTRQLQNKIKVLQIQCEELESIWASFDDDVESTRDQFYYFFKGWMDQSKLTLNKLKGDE